MKEPSIQSLFPNPVYISHINRKFTEKELDFVNNQKNINLLYFLVKK